MTAAAIYARKSSDDSAKNDEARSTARQVARATEYATAKGWTVDPRHVFIDDAVSGAEWKHRPGFNALLVALEPRPPFGVLIVSELSRIGRDTVRTPAAILQLEEAGVEIRSYLSDSPITLSDESGEIMTVVHSLAASFERRRARARTYDALRRRAEAGAVTGGTLYGYRNARNGTGYVYRLIDDAEAMIVRRVFGMYAEGAGIVTIAHTLNAEGVPPPRARGWAPSGIREMLHRRTYVGEVEWGKLQKVTRRGTKHQRHRPESEWLTVPVPELRIIPEDLWQRVNTRLAECAAAMPMVGGRGVPRFTVDSAYLLVGLARCAACGASIGTELRAHGSAGHRRHVPHYSCLGHRRQGPAMCKNAVGLRQDFLDEAILAAIAETLTPAVLAVAVDKAVAILTGDAAERGGRRVQLERELTEAQQRIDRLVAALADGAMPTDEIRPRLVAEKARKTALAAELGRKVAPAPPLDVTTLRRDLDARAADAVGLLSGETEQARRVLRALLHDKIDCEPFGRGRLRGYRFSGSLRIGRVIGGASLTEHARTVVAPTGFEPVFQP
jgi:site-specific DNA recombinase